MGLIKSHSNYVLKKKHQLVSDGTVFERDITTIGAVNQFSPGQTPIYRSGNFIITVNGGTPGTNQYNTNKWEKGIDGDYWNMNTVAAMTSDDETQDDTNIVLKNDYYDFREFAYYGSLTELFRSSVRDILERFPGELYCVPKNDAESAVYYTSGITEDFQPIKESVRLGEKDGLTLYEVSNPYGINIHTKLAPSDAKPLKYFANGGFKNYAVWGQELRQESDWVVTTFDGCKPGDKVAEITLGGVYKIYAYIGDEDKIYYLHDGVETNGMFIRPKSQFITEFYNGCNDLQRLMLNPETSPKYKAMFSVIGMNDFGYTRSFENFIYPTSKGDYNPSADGEYFNRLIEIGEFYDEYLTDNLYRSMTHEAIKNFDWTYSREYNEGDEVEYVHGGEKIKKALRIFAREFDEQKKYIDNIRYTGRITYDGRGNLPDYFLADVCEDDGWDVKSVIPYDLSGITDYSDTALLANSGGTHIYSQSSVSAVTPYSTDYVKDGTEYGYFLECRDSASDDISGCLHDWYSGGSECSMAIRPANEDEKEIMLHRCDNTSRIESRIRSYFDDTKEYTYLDVNNEFLRRLKLNSRSLWRHKGTLEGIEMILGMFGLKSSRWIGKTKSCRYSGYKPTTCGTVGDYDIIEYTQFTTPIEDEWDSTHQMYTIDWINSTKTITYDYRSTSNYTLPGNMGGLYAPYQGLPVAYLDKSDGKRYLYPNFSKEEQIDGNPYFQMDGGWLAKTLSDKQNFQFDVDDNIVHNPVETNPRFVNGFVYDNHKLYKETIRAIKRVENLRELLSIPGSQLHDGAICYVGRISNEVAVIDGDVYDVEYDGNNKFVRFVFNGHYIKVGSLYFDESIVVYDINGDETPYYLDDKLEGYEVKAFINGGNFVCYSQENAQYCVNSFKLITTSESSSYSNYFKLDDTVFSDTITYESDGNGWRRLQYKDADYLKINTISNYYDGNNGHTGLMKYDSGHDYFTYFQRLFKYAEDNELFDTRCYREGYNDLYDELNPNGVPRGFSGLINPNEVVTDYDKFLHKDTKVHYFGNYKTRKGGTDNDKNDIDKIYIYGTPDEYDRCKCTNMGVTTKTYDPWRCFYGGKEPTYYQITSNANGRASINGEIQPHTSTDPVTNQIVNNKRFKIVFNMKNSFNSKQGQIELKYIDDIVMNYLTQMIPSTVITEIEYNFCGFTNTDC